MSDETGDKPKIIIDEDWKSRAEAEKAKVESKPVESKPVEKQPVESKPAADTPAAAERPQPAAKPQQPQPAQQLPPATLPVLLSTLATQAMVFLGQIPNPMSGKNEVALPEAQHFIDTLTMLQAKTAGNRTPEEDRMFDAILNELRRAFVYVSGTQQK